MLMAIQLTQYKSTIRIKLSSQYMQLFPSTSIFKVILMKEKSRGRIQVKYNVFFKPTRIYYFFRFEIYQLNYSDI